ncbi:hypothetical protein LEP1GSC026_0006 [Leptospira interrogans str. 2002000623]|nr:hypothetical protein LEP1GSC026_0006 [Leptospira interrogans str. 2002000623]
MAISLTMNRSIGSQSFRIAKSILNKGIQVIVLNPGNLATIYQSLKKQIKKTLSRLRDSYNVFQ